MALLTYHLRLLLKEGICPFHYPSEAFFSLRVAIIFERFRVQDTQLPVRTSCLSLQNGGNIRSPKRDSIHLIEFSTFLTFCLFFSPRTPSEKGVCSKGIFSSWSISDPFSEEDQKVDTPESLSNPFKLTHLCLASCKRDISKQCRPRPDAAVRGVLSGSTLFQINIRISIKHSNNKNNQTPLLLVVDESKDLR